MLSPALFSIERQHSRLPQGSASRIQVFEAKAGPKRRHLLDRHVGELSANGAESWLVSCDLDVGGPWAGVNGLFSALIGEILRQRHDLAERHALELIHLLPALQKRLKLPHASLTDTALPHERVRNYATDRAFRLVHGLIDLLDAWKKAVCKDRAWYIACDDYDRSGAIGRHFFRELMRRRGEILDIHLIVAVEPGAARQVNQWFDATAKVEVVSSDPELDLDLEFANEQLPAPLTREVAGRLAAELEEKIGEDSVAAEVHVNDLIRLWRLTDRTDKLLHWKQFATEYYTRLGLYEDLTHYTEGLLSLANAHAPHDERRRLWILNKTLTGYMGAPDSWVGMKFVEAQVLPVLENADSSEHVNLFFLIAMMYARYSKPRDLAKGEEFLDRGLRALERIGPSKLYHFQYVFNRNGLAMIRTFQSRFQDAIDLCRAGIDRLNRHLGSDEHRLHRSVLVYNIAQVYFAMGAYKEAIEHFTAVIALDPEFSEYHNERGNIFLRVGRLGEARADYLEAIRLSPPYCEVHTNLGQCYRRMGEFNEAIACYTRALDLKPDQILALVGRAKACEELGQREQAIADYSAALNEDPAQWDALASRGVLHYEAGDLVSSLGDFDRAIQLAPNQRDLYKNRSIVLTELGRHADGASDIETALRLNPDAEDSAELRDRLTATLTGVA